MDELIIFIWIIGSLYTFGAFLNSVTELDWYGWILIPITCFFLWPFMLGGLRK